MRNILAMLVAKCMGAMFYLLLPLSPALVAMLLMRWRFVRDYAHTLHRMRVHLTMLRQGPLQHYFRDVWGGSRQIPEEILGSCVQCGNCCMQRQCAFLEPIADDKYQCGIYHSWWRRFSNCGSFPLNQRDIERYACPSYHVAISHSTDETPTLRMKTQAVAIRWVGNRPEVGFWRPD